MLDAANVYGKRVRMTFQSSPDERKAAVVADTSVVINLNATGCADAICVRWPTAVSSSSRSHWSFRAVSEPVTRMLTPLPF